MNLILELRNCIGCSGCTRLRTNDTQLEQRTNIGEKEPHETNSVC